MKKIRRVLRTSWETIPFFKTILTGLTIAYGSALYAQQSAVELHWSPANPEPQDEVTLSFTMGTYENQATDVHTVEESFSYADSAFQLSSGPNDTIPLDGTGSWFANDQNWSGYMLIDSANKKIILRMYRPSTDPRSGYETLVSGGEIVVVIEDIAFRKGNRPAFRTRLYPSPSSGRVFVESVDGEPIKQITIINMAGQLVETFTVNQPVFKADLHSLPSQMYILRIEGNNGQYENHRWIKQ
jgi:hypothetical protein